MVASQPRSVVVTGAAGGVGLIIARKHVEAGHRVHICDADEESLAAAVHSLPGTRASCVDVGRKDDVERLFVEASWLDGIDVLVNNVGIAGEVAAIEDLSADDLLATMKVNAIGALHCMQSVIPEMKTRRAGSIINISSASTRTRLPMRTSYIVSKFALEGLTLNAARELGPWSVRCNAILPGPINNARMDQIIKLRAEREGRSADTVNEDYLKFISLRRRTEPEDVADMTLFLGSEGASAITGELISVSGNLEWES